MLGCKASRTGPAAVDGRFTYPLADQNIGKHGYHEKQRQYRHEEPAAGTSADPPSDGFQNRAVIGFMSIIGFADLDRPWMGRVLDYRVTHRSLFLSEAHQSSPGRFLSGGKAAVMAPRARLA